MKERGVDVYFIQYKSKFDNRYKVGEDLKLDIPNRFIYGNPFLLFFEIIRLHKNGYNFIYGNTHIGSFISLPAKLIGMNLISDIHGNLVGEFLLNNEGKSWKRSPLKVLEYLLKELINFSVLRMSNTIICVSKKMIDFLHSEEKIPYKRMTYLTNGIDLNFFKPIFNEEEKQLLKKKLGIENKKVFGYVGNFDKWQGVENFISAANILENEKISFLFVGAKKEDRLKNMVFLPKVSREEVLLCYSICDVLVLPRPNSIATQVAAPTKFAEYAAMQKPILTTDVGDAAELVKKYDCGIVVDDNSPENLKKGVISFLDMDNENIKKMGENSRKLAQNEFDWEKQIDSFLKYEKFY